MQPIPLASRSCLTASVFACLLFSCPERVWSQDDSAKAKHLIDAVAAVMKDAPAIAFESEVRTKLESVEFAQKAKIVLKRPNLARLELSGLGQDAVIVLDGATSWHYIKARNKFVKSKQVGTTKLEQYGVGPAAILFFEKATGSLLPYLSNATVTKEKLGGEECDVVTWKVGSEETRLWIRDTRLRSYRTTRSLGGKELEQTIDYGAFDLSPTIADAAFVFDPPAGAEQIGAGDESKLLAVGTDAPDFTATSLDGSVVKLSGFKGKPVLLSFWFYACSTCREELPQLQKLKTDYAKRALVTVAVNFGDKPDVVGAYFEKAKLSFMPVLQKKNEVSAAFGVQAYPTNYLIGPDGKVAWRASGFDETSLRAALDKIAPPE